MSGDRPPGAPVPCVPMPLDAVSHLNPGWRCWDEPAPGTGRCYAEREGYGRLTATTPEGLHDRILVAEAHAACPVPPSADRLPST